MNVSPLPRSFFDRPTLTVARDLLGTSLVRVLPDGHRLCGRVVETEAYIGPHDSASHARAGRTPRTSVMFGPPGIAYVYLVYGIHWMLNVVTEAEEFPGAVLIRALEPQEGLTIMQQQRPVRRPRDLTNGPAKLCQALAITGAFQGHNLTTGHTLWFAPGEQVPETAVARTPRIGINYAAAADRDAPWRLIIKDNLWVSQ